MRTSLPDAVRRNLRTATAGIAVAGLTAAGLAMAPAVQTDSTTEDSVFSFGADNIREECLPEMDAELADGSPNPDYWYAQSADADAPAPEGAICHHMATDMNGLDTPVVDVLIVAPASPTVERDTRIMRQSIEMWEAGIDYIAEREGLDWLAEGMDFRISVSALEHGEVTLETYPIVDPEIVVVATNPVGGIGIGIDPVDFLGDIGLGDGEGLCHGIPNPLGAFAAWDALPGFDNHHGTSGTYVADCQGEDGESAGGNVCFAVNGAIDPLPEDTFFYDNVIDFQLFDLVSHEVGHCLTIGHVGDGAEGDWAAVAPNDIMAYDTAPADLSKCVSTLDVESIATVMSRYLDTDGDGDVASASRRSTSRASRRS